MRKKTVKNLKKLKSIDENINENDIYNIGPTIGAHLGSGTFGFTVVEK